jgi:hypothetical protein
MAKKISASSRFLQLRTEKISAIEETLASGNTTRLAIAHNLALGIADDLLGYFNSQNGKYCAEKGKDIDEKNYALFVRRLG